MRVRRSLDGVGLSRPFSRQEALKGVGMHPLHAELCPSTLARIASIACQVRNLLCRFGRRRTRTGSGPCSTAQHTRDARSRGGSGCVADCLTTTSRLQLRRARGTPLPRIRPGDAQRERQKAEGGSLRHWAASVRWHVLLTDYVPRP